MQINTEIFLKKMLNEVKSGLNRKNITVFLLFFILVSGFICAKSTEKQENSPLPDTRPGDISFRYHVNGGMMYYFENLYISADSCYYEVNDGGSLSKTYFKMLPEQLDKLYKVLKENEFDEIETYEEKVYDRGGENISLSWGKGNYCNVSNSGITFIKNSWHKEWNNCENVMVNIIKEEIPKYKKDYEIRLDKSLFGKEVYLQLNRDAVIPKSMLMSENGMDEFISRVVKLSPGKHRISMNIGKTYQNFEVNSDSSKGILLYLSSDTIKHKYMN